MWYWSKNDKKWVLGSLGSLFEPKKKLDQFPDTFHIPTKSMRTWPRFFSFSRNLKNLNHRSDFKMNQICEILSEFAHSEIWWRWKWKLPKKEKKIEIFDILDPRFTAEAIIGRQNFCGIFAIWSIFGVPNVENRFFVSSPENALIQLQHTSIRAKSDRNSLIWLKMKSERSSQKQHFFSHFKQIQLKMR